MSFFSRFFASEPAAAPAARDPLDDFWFSGLGHGSAAGEPVTVASALTVPVVYSCCMTLTETVSQLPFGVFEQSGDDKLLRRNHPIMAVLDDPNEDETGCEFIAGLVWDLATEGEAIIVKTPGPRGPVDRLERLAPSRVTVERGRDGKRLYRVAAAGLPERRYLAEEIWHLRRPPTQDGLRGTSPIHCGRETIGAAIALQKYAARFFANDATPPFVFEHPGNFESADDKRAFLDAWKRWFGGKKRGQPGVLEFGMKVSKLAATNEEAQFLETRRELNVELARLWRMQPHKVGILDRATFTNIEEQSLDFVIGTLLPWLRLIEHSIRKHLIQASDRYFFEFNVAGLLRGDLQARYAAYATARQWGWMSVNDILRRENMNPIGPRGDVYLQPMNMVPAGASPAETETASATAKTIDFLRRSAADSRPRTARPPAPAARPQLVEFAHAA